MSSAILISDDLVSNKMISFNTSFYCHWHHLTKEHLLLVFICLCVCCKQASKSLSKYICLTVILQIRLVTLHWNSNFTLALCTLGNLFIWETTSYFQANDSTNFVQYVCLGLRFPLCTIFSSCLVSHCCLFSINLSLMTCGSWEMILETFDIFDIKFLLYNKDRYKFYRSFQQ